MNSKKKKEEKDSACAMTGERIVINSCFFQSTQVFLFEYNFYRIHMHIQSSTVVNLSFFFVD